MSAKETFQKLLGDAIFAHDVQTRERDKASALAAPRTNADENRRDTMTEKQPWAGLIRAIGMDANALAAEKGEGNILVQIKRNSERLEDCPRHDFDPQPGWRDRPGPFIYSKITCMHCGGEMKTHDAMVYLRGLAHGAGLDYVEITNRIWPKEPSP